MRWKISNDIGDQSDDHQTTINNDVRHEHTHIQFENNSKTIGCQWEQHTGSNDQTGRDVMVSIRTKIDPLSQKNFNDLSANVVTN